MVKVSLKQRGLRPFKIYEIRARPTFFEILTKNTEDYAERLLQITLEDYEKEYGDIAVADDRLPLYNDFEGRPVRLVGYRGGKALDEEDLVQIERNLEELAERYL